MVRTGAKVLLLLLCASPPTIPLSLLVPGYNFEEVFRFGGGSEGGLGAGEIINTGSVGIPSALTSSGERTFAICKPPCVIVGGSEFCPFDGR